ncbi:unnamed protein product (macronuclear) [Paramecium tetraurelia]|uniref:Uncharacterized protein n=1 Tax=Paramecium tetraurelia TaxID=5888 RepID=A0BZN1_PARTE|nr:uncharacterized protein GSPATT00005850001 [Paramecium tetraurelia]CAK63998.1 unnamed protein product [Paramecium tetraurelia]|eukprot:XP_001431396.1 hypothetical protein (macronuclear) [Paramecium tetraurelia strain d4-2]
MFSKKIKKQEIKLIDNDKDDDQLQYSNLNQHPQIDKSIQKQKRVGINVQQLAKEKQISQKKSATNNERERNFLNQDSARGLTSINYIKQKTEKPDKLMEKYVQEKIKSVDPLAFCGQVENVQDEQQRDAELLEEIRETQAKFLSKNEEKDPSFYVGGIIQVNLSLEEEAQKLAQMEDLKRDQYIQTIIQGKPKRAAPVVVHPDEEEDKETKAFRELKSKFYQKGRIFKYQQMKKTIDNIKPEIEQSKS